MSSACVTNRLLRFRLQKKEDGLLYPTHVYVISNSCSHVSEISKHHILLMFLHLMHIHQILSLSILLTPSAGRVRLSADFRRPDVTKYLTEVGRLL
jgi:hypothetical protein